LAAKGSIMKYAAVGPISVYLPDLVEENETLAKLYPKWDMDLIGKKTGIYARHIAAPDQCASDLGVAAAEKLFAEHAIDRNTVDFLLLCTQTPDYPLPTTACLMQDRLGLPTSVGALDFNLGCSGFVYGLSLADGLIRSGAADRVLLVTAETYSKYIDPTDRSLRTIFGDGAAATLIEAADEPSVGSFVFGTDGRGAGTLIVNDGGARPLKDSIQPTKRKRWPSRLYMDGPELVKFTLDVVPPMIEQILARAKISRSEVDFGLVHQATAFLLDNLRTRLEMSEELLPTDLDYCGNTVSSTLPILMRDLRLSGRLQPGKRSLLLGFGVGLSWAGCAWTETWVPNKPQTDQSSTVPALGIQPADGREKSDGKLKRSADGDGLLTSATTRAERASR
jgi:3-oxoacyl-[acyl-carrier-protein] synthase-3